MPIPVTVATDSEKDVPRRAFVAQIMGPEEQPPPRRTAAPCDVEATVWPAFARRSVLDERLRRVRR